MTAAAPKKKSPVLAIVLGCLAIVVLGAIGLAVVAFSGFRGFVEQSKRSESVHELKSLFLSSAAYYAQEHFESGGPVTSCTVGPAITSNRPGPARTVLDWSREPEPFRALGFAPADPLYYRYEIEAGPGRCGHAAGERAVYTFRAHGDLDGNGRQDRLELPVATSDQNELYRSPTFRVIDEDGSASSVSEGDL